VPKIAPELGPVRRLEASCDSCDSEDIPRYVEVLETAAGQRAALSAS
jgi:hypothetical protein